MLLRKIIKSQEHMWVKNSWLNQEATSMEFEPITFCTSLREMAYMIKNTIGQNKYIVCIYKSTNLDLHYSWQAVHRIQGLKFGHLCQVSLIHFMLDSGLSSFPSFIADWMKTYNEMQSTRTHKQGQQRGYGAGRERLSWERIIKLLERSLC